MTERAMGTHEECQPPFASSSGEAPAAQSLWHERTGALIQAMLSEEQHRFLAERLDQLRQGDLINLGATSIVGQGPSPTLRFADPRAVADVDQPWSVTLVTELGWYVVLSQDCDIARSPGVEPCIVVCPLEAMPMIEWQSLRSGPYSAREFPFPEHAHITLPGGTAGVANARFITSVEKQALLAPAFRRAAPLTPPLRLRFREWVARRFARAPHPDHVETHVLQSCGHRITRLAKAGRAQPNGRSRSQMLVLMADEWYIAPGEQLIPLQLIITAASAQTVGLWDEASADFAVAAIEAARKELQSDLNRRITPGLGYALTVGIHTLDRVAAETYRSWTPWTWDAGSTWSGPAA